ncbi:hypothetical protein [Brachyspira murdochii]|uniref:Transmembrane protein n=1 Tax=Brachyspira murdochii TaxID=84378 RepID=A0ABX5B1S5_9SPIR|nr:hypothetical protein [Brachyspira murdochii]PPS21113.1 hypothetical protein DJ52_12855 [Brachyspira murdochii]
MKNRTEQNRTEQNRTEQNRTEQNRTEQNRTEQTNTLNFLFSLKKHIYFFKTSYYYHFLILKKYINNLKPIKYSKLYILASIYINIIKYKNFNILFIHKKTYQIFIANNFKLGDK